MLQCFEELLEALCVAVRHQVPATCGNEEWAVHEDMFYHLNKLAALVCDLLWSMFGEKPLCVFPSEGVSCNEPIKSRMCQSGKHSFRPIYVRAGIHVAHCLRCGWVFC